MTPNLDLCLALHGAHARMTAHVDEALGVHHGLDLSGLALLLALSKADAARLSLAALAQRLSLPRSVVLRQVLAMEKTGHLAREEAQGARTVALRPAGRALARAACDTADAACHLVWVHLPVTHRQAFQSGLSALAGG